MILTLIERLEEALTGAEKAAAYYRGSPRSHPSRVDYAEGLQAGLESALGIAKMFEKEQEIEQILCAGSQGNGDDSSQDAVLG